MLTKLKATIFYLFVGFYLRNPLSYFSSPYLSLYPMFNLPYSFTNVYSNLVNFYSRYLLIYLLV